MGRSRSTRLAALTLANVLLPISVLVFALGFFPFKPLLPGLATFEDTALDLPGNGEHPPAIFDRVVFIVVDALRTDFVYGHDSGFQFTQNLIRDGAAIPFTAHATPPTVTMPRIKALTTGSVPSFADLIFNLDESDSGSSLAGQDTWLAQIRAKGGKLVFYGDDTWLRLFPGAFFARAEGTSSFFVSDFTEVDHNVTRHVPGELANRDWDAMILHYLGLDHIGHKTGPLGPNMKPKQIEMDAIVRLVYEAMEMHDHHANTLLVLAGDHGMNAGGNHGGSGPGETEPALLFASPKLKQRARRQDYECPTVPKDGTEFHYYAKREQSDLVPTLAGLMGFPVPKNGLGVFMPEFLGLWPDPGSSTGLLHRNCLQVKRIIDAAFGFESFSEKVKKWRQHSDTSSKSSCSAATGDEDELACRWATVDSSLSRVVKATNGDWGVIEPLQLDFLELAQEVLSNTASSYDIPRMVIGMVIVAFALALSLLSVPSLLALTAESLAFALTSVLYGVMMFASSYVEEEQHFWYWLTPAWIVLLTLKSTQRTQDEQAKWRLAAAGILIVAVHRVAIRWNQTGQKHTGDPDVVHTFFPEHHVLMWMLILATYCYTGLQLIRKTLANLVAQELSVLLAVSMVLPAVVFKLNFTQADAPELVQDLALQVRAWSSGFDLVRQAQFTFVLLGLTTIAVMVLSIGLARTTVLAMQNSPAVRITLPERLHYLLMLFLITQSRASNIPLFLGLELQRKALALLLNPPKSHSEAAAVPSRNADIRPTQLAQSVLLFSHVYFFCTGGSNSISSVDLSNAYNGVANYNVVAVGALLFASNWTGPIWWCSAAVVSTFAKPREPPANSKTTLNGARSWVDIERERLREDATAVARSASGGSPSPTELWMVYLSNMTAFIATSLLAVMAACTALRTHLFIWTVFSPKYLYAMAWCIGWHLMVNLGFGSLLRYLGQIA